MKRIVVTVPWEHGLHMRPAASLARLAGRYRSSMLLRLGRRTADIRSLLAIVSLCAMMGTTLEVEVTGDDEDLALDAIERVFAHETDDGASDATR